MNTQTTIAAFALVLSCLFHTATATPAINHASPQTGTQATDLLAGSDLRYIIVFKHKPRQKNASNTEMNTIDHASVFADQQFSISKAQAVVGAIGGHVVHALPSIKGLSARLNQQQLAQMRHNPDVAFIEEDPLREFQAEQKSYGLSQIQADLLSDVNTGNISVCIADTGIDLNHEDLPAGANISGEVSNTLTKAMDIGEWFEDSHGHGTHMAGTIAAIGDNNMGTVGINPGGNINLHIVKIVDHPGWWPFRGSDMIAAVERCRAAGANIINMSIAGNKSSMAEQQAMQAAYDSGILLVAAAGNGGSQYDKYPASYDAVISATAIDNQETRWIYSHFNSQIELSAPGVTIKSTTPGNQYSNWDGTSIAAAYISGAAGLVWSHHPECNNAEIRHILHQTAKDLGDAGRDHYYGYGLIQAKDALELIDLGGCDGIINNPPTIDGAPADSVNQDQFYQFVATIFDADEDDKLTITIDNPPLWAYFDPTSGELSGIPDNSDVGIYSNISISVTDGSDSVTTTPFSITVVNVNDAPTISTVADTQAEQDSPYQYIIAADDQDLDTTLTFSAPTLPDWLSFDANGKILSGTPLNADVGDHAVELQVTDGTAITSQNVTVTVANVNDTPSIDGTPATSVDEDSPYSFTPTAADIDITDTLSFSIDGQPLWASFNQTDGTLGGTPTNEQVGTHGNIVISVTDGTETVSLPAFDITVVNVNDAPTITGTPATSVNEDTSYSFTPTAADVDVGDTLAFSISGKPAWASFDTTSGSLSGTPTNDHVGTHGNIVISVTDDDETVSLAAFAITVNNVNDAPTIIGTPMTSVNENRNYLFMPTASDPDNDELNFSISGKPAWASFDSNTGQLSGNPGGIGNAVHNNIVITVSDGDLSDELSFTITVVASLYNDWENSGDPTGHSSWTPAVNNQTSNFNQSRRFKQAQTRTEQQQQLNAGGTTTNVGNLIIHNRIIDGSESRTVVVTVTEWINVGTPYDCSNWLPNPDSVNLGENFTQTRTCKKDRQRDWFYKVGSLAIATRAESNTINDNETQSATGTCPSTAHDWINDEDRYDYSAWSPTPDSQTASYNQTRSYQQDQNRTIERCDKRTYVENKTINGTENRSITVTFSGWNDSSRTDHSTWSPAPGNQTSNFVQSRTYTQDQTGSYTHKLGTTVIHSHAVSKELTGQSEFRNVTVSWSNWIDVGGHNNCGDWSATPDNQTSNYNQTRTCKQNQQRDRNYTAAGTIIHSATETRTIDETESRSITVTFSGWSDSDRTDHSTWSPTPGNQTGNFVQSRTYTQDQTGSYTHKLGTTVIHSHAVSKELTGQSESRSITVTFSGWSDSSRTDNSTWSPTPGNQTGNFVQSRTYTQNQTGSYTHKLGATVIHTYNVSKALTGQTESRSITVTFSGWSDSSRTAHSTWSPAPGNQTSNFEQTRSYTQDQTGSYTHKLGATVIHSHAVSKALTGQTESRDVTVTWLNWNDVDGHYNCGSWSAAPDNQTSNYNQTRTCQQNQQRDRNYTVAGTIIHSATETRTIDETESRSITVTFSGWSDSSRTDHSTWSPAPGNQTSNFEQTRSYTQNQTGSYTHKLGATVIHSHAVSKALTGQSESRDVTVTWSGWQGTTRTNYTPWSPAADGQTSGFSQSRTYTQNQAGAYTHKVGSNTIHTRDVTRALTSQSESRSVTVSWTGWADQGGLHSCSSWSPDPDSFGYGGYFIQSRRCTQTQTRNRNYTANATIITTKSESQEIWEWEQRDSIGTGFGCNPPMHPPVILCPNDP